MKYTFETALVFLKQGKLIRRASWSKYFVCVALSHGVIYDFFQDNGTFFPAPYKASSDDLLADDWEVLDEKKTEEFKYEVHL